MRSKRLMGLMAIFAVAGLALGAGRVEAQVSADAGAQFVGKWTIAFEPMAAGGAGGGPPAGTRPGGGGPPGGGAGGGGGGRGGPQVLDIIVENGQLKGTLTGGMGGPREITSITREGSVLVLTYSLGMGGQTMPATLRLTPDGATMKAEMAAAQFNRTGTATKTP